jgi:hypothetical protein
MSHCLSRRLPGATTVPSGIVTSLTKVRLSVQVGVKVGTAGIIKFEKAVGCS